MSNCPEFQVPYRPAAESMTMRDYFAAAALQGFLAHKGYDHQYNDEVAGVAYAQADAMLAERSKR